jgi:hypothetical protein
MLITKLCLIGLLAHLKHVKDLPGLVLGQDPDPDNLRVGSEMPGFPELMNPSNC